MKNTRRKLALAGVVLLLIMCILPLVFSIVFPDSGWFKASIACVILIPVVLYAFLLVLKVTRPAKSPLIDGIIFDVGNVLVDFDWKAHMENLGFDADTIDYLRIHMMENPLWNELDRGKRPFGEIVDEFCRLNASYESQIRSFFEEPEKTITERSYTLPWLQDLRRAGYKLYVLSNWDEPIYENLKDSVLSFEKYLDGAIWSYQHKCVKPEPEIYQKLIDLYGLNPDRCVFLDDRQENLDAARPFGFNTILVTSHEAALEGLRTLGVK